MQLYYEDIIEGSSIPSKSWGPLTNMDMIRFGSALDSYGEIHQDYDWCIEHGFDNVLLSGPFKQALICSWLDEVVGDIGYIKKIEVSHRGINYVNETLTASGTFTKTYTHEGNGFVECDIAITNENGLVSCPGKATILVPMKEMDSIEFNFTAPVTYEEFLTKKISAEFTDPTNIYLTKEIIDMIGAMGESYTWPEPLDISSIRRFTQGVFETKSRYVDIDYAQKSLIGSLIAPPAYVIRPPFGFWDKGMLGESAIPVFTVPNTTVAVNGGNESEWYKVVKEGDTLTQQARVIDIYEKKGAKRSLIPVVSETIFINQDSEVVALSKQINIRMP